MTIPPSDLLSQGHYARKQIFSRSRIIAWSHRRRFQLASDLAGGGGRLLDYGCGDGTFIALAYQRFASSVGTDADEAQLRDCASRLGRLDGVGFVPLADLRRPEHAARYDVVTCMEVLEHCPVDVQQVVLEDIDRVLAPGGRLIVSVPIEVGPTLAVKQAVRAFAAMTGLKEYAGRERYRPGEFVRTMFARSSTRIPRQETTERASDGTVLRFHGHKGFNWRALEPIIGARFTIERRVYSPVPFSGPWLNSQVWFVCRKGLWGQT